MSHHLSHHRFVRLAILSVSALDIILYIRFCPPEHERCALCESAYKKIYLAPALMNLSTGDLMEMEVYRRDAFNHGRLASEQPTEFVRLIQGAGAEGVLNGGDACRVFLPKEPGRINLSLYSCERRKILTETAAGGYALLDLYDREKITAYPLREGSEYAIRDSIVFVCQDPQLRRMRIDVIGQMSIE